MVVRTEHRRSTLERLSEAAVEAFEAHGSSATVDAIAERAGVSRRTAFRYIDSKESLAFIHPMIWLEVFDASQTATEDPGAFAAITRGAQAIADHVDSDPTPVRRAFAVAVANPELLSGYASVNANWVDRFTALILEHAPDTDPLAARILGSATMGMIDAVTAAWVADDTMSYRAALERGLATIEPMLDQAVR